MVQLIKLASWPGNPSGHAIFVHGLGGHAYDTWRGGKDDNALWPLWLARDIEGLTVWTLSYAAPPTNWLGNALPLQDRAVTILERLLGAPELVEAPIAFVCHSLGGLVVKQVLREANDQAKTRPEAGAFLKRVKAVVFIATPHTGSAHANWLGRLRFIAWPSTAAQDIVKNDANLRNLNFWYRNNLSKRIANCIFYEAAGTAAGTIVDPGSADAGFTGVVPIPIEGDHIAIAKPRDDSDLIYERTRDFLAKDIFRQARAARRRGPVEIPMRPSVSTEVPNTWVPRAIRIFALLMVGFIGFKGIQATFLPPDPLKAASVQQIEQILRNNYPDATPEQIRQFLQALENSRSEPTFEKAVEEAEKGNIRVAQGIWRQKYENEGKVADKLADEARKNKAKAARNIAATTVLENAAEGLSWYRKATELDPQNMGGWIGRGDAAMSSGTLKEANDAFQHFISLAKRAKDERGEAGGYDKLGNVLVREGKLAEARKAYTTSLDIAKRLAEADPINTGRQRDLSVNHEKVGDLLVREGNLVGARKAYQDSLNIRKRLAKAEPTNALYQRDLSVIHNKLGDLLVLENNLVEARTAYQDSLDIRKSLTDAHRTNAEYQRDLSTSHEKFGNVLMQEGNLDGARRFYQDSFDIRKELVDKNPSNTEYQHDLSVSYGNLGDVLVRKGNLADARKAYQHSFDILKRLTGIDPANEEYQRDFSKSYERFGDLLVQENNLAEARKAYDDSLDIRKFLAGANPTDAEYKYELAVTYGKLGDVPAKDSGLREKSLEALQNASAILKQLTELAPENVRWQNDLERFEVLIRNLTTESSTVTAPAAPRSAGGQ